MVERLKVHIEGRVQGVGFRYATHKQATNLGLAGWVRNRSDGSVEAEFEGERESLERMLDWCQNGPSFAFVTNLAKDWDSGPPQYDGFHVRG